MLRTVDVDRRSSLDDYAAVATLAAAVQDLRVEASVLLPRLRDRTVWMVNSAERGGGVAEMLPAQVSLLRELGVRTEWLVIEPEEPDFFPLTKRVHNLIHGEGDPALTRADRALYERVSRRVADALRERVRPGDLLVVHDPQPLGAGAMVRDEMRVAGIWRCHIGLDRETPQTRAAWEFLRPYALAMDHAVFSVPEYIPEYLAGRATVIHPAIDPFSHKNRDLPIHKLVGVLRDAGLADLPGPLLMPPFPEPARRLQPDGSWAEAVHPVDAELLVRPVVLQVSRWDRLKGWGPLMEGFTRLKNGVAAPARHSVHHRRREIVRLVLAGPDPASIQDDPEAVEVLDALRDRYLALPERLQRDVAILSLPMSSTKHNWLMVNALQRCSSVVSQNSLREGFGLTATEAMWKGVPVMASSAAGLRQQVRDELDGRIVQDPTDPDEVARALDAMLADEKARARWGRTAQRRAYDEFLIFAQLRRWLEGMAEWACEAEGRGDC